VIDPRVGRLKPRRAGGDGEPEAFCADEQSDHAIDLSRWQRLALNVLRDEGVSGAAEMTVIYVDRDTMAILNLQYMGKVGATDVLAFPLDMIEAMRTPGPGAQSKSPDKSPPHLGDLPLLLGDVVICPSVAFDQASRHAGTFDDEMALLLVHGILHVLGEDHDNEVNEQRMHARERAHLERHHWHGEAPSAFRHIPESAS
jgi:probable rRNA maturation factor